MCMRLCLYRRDTVYHPAIFFFVFFPIIITYFIFGTLINQSKNSLSPGTLLGLSRRIFDKVIIALICLDEPHVAGHTKLV